MILTTPEPSGDFRKPLNSYGSKWMLENLMASEYIPWLAKGLRSRTLLCVTDGSNMDHLCLDAAVQAGLYRPRDN